jgi:hypothetical protein
VAWIGVGRLTGIADRFGKRGTQQVVTVGVPAVDGCLRDSGGLGHSLDRDGAWASGAEEREAGGQDAPVRVRGSWPASPRRGIPACLRCVYHWACSFGWFGRARVRWGSLRYKLRVV